MKTVHLIHKIRLSLGAAPLALFQEVKMRLNCDESAVVKCAILLLHEVVVIYSTQHGWKVMARNRHFPESDICIDPLDAFKNRSRKHEGEPMMPDLINIDIDQETGVCLLDLIPLFEDDPNYVFQYAISTLLSMIFKYTSVEGWNLQAEHELRSVEQIKSYQEIFK